MKAALREVDITQREKLSKAVQSTGRVLPERRDPPEAVTKKAQLAANILASALHVTCYTGAGVSTAAAIPDYRGPDGVWTKLRRGETAQKIKLDNIMPTFTHRAIAALWERGLIKHVVTTNVDDLHHKAGLPTEAISELHGNRFVEQCATCGRKYRRDFDVDQSKGTAGFCLHETGRRCESAHCSGVLRDTIVNFGDDLPEDEYEEAEKHADKTDVALVLGTSLCVSPARDLPLQARVVIFCNLQVTKYDHRCKVRAFTTTDNFMKQITAALCITVS